jgi:hypothetical protein
LQEATLADTGRALGQRDQVERARASAESVLLPAVDTGFNFARVLPFDEAAQWQDWRQSRGPHQMSGTPPPRHVAGCGSTDGTPPRGQSKTGGGAWCMTVSTMAR